MLVAVPRLVASLSPDGLPPVGEAIWGDTRLVLPQTAASGYQNVFTDGRIPIDRDGARAHVRAVDLFAHFPAACAEAGEA